MNKIERTIRNTVNSLYMKQVAERKGWSLDQAKEKVIDFIFNGKVSLFDYMENA